MPKAQALMSNAAYDPATVKMLTQAFDEAWASVAGNYQSALAIEGARLRLANIVLNLASEGERDPSKLKDRAVRTLSVDAS
jgi:hypothetical protein